MNGEAPLSTDDRVAVEATLFRYARALDRRRWDLLDTVFSPDVVATYGADRPCEGREAVVASIRRYLDDCGPTQHMIGNVEAERDGDRVRTQCVVQAAHRARHGGETLVVLGRYEGEWSKRGGDWSIDHWLMHADLSFGEPSVLDHGEQGR